MGILNVTPDSFSDGGRYLALDAAIDHGLRMLDEGADIIDVGGQSTRPQGAQPVPLAEEIARVVPVIEALARERPDATISVDTVQSEVARAGTAAGAHIVNDVSGLRLDPQIAPTCGALGVGVILMHSRGGISDMATFAHAAYQDVVTEVVAELDAAAGVAASAGIAPNAIAVDPGIGFAKRPKDSLKMLGALPVLARWKRPIVVGVSRKRFIDSLTGATQPAERLDGTLGANVAAMALGAHIFRVHDVRANRAALDVAWGILGGDRE